MILEHENASLPYPIFHYLKKMYHGNEQISQFPIQHEIINIVPDKNIKYLVCFGLYVATIVSSLYIVSY